jgi:bifunctional UDP-N-acetylglucosamine pyrophosphorylase/glucosamine-1-phosphate N-acetyltransferase
MGQYAVILAAGKGTRMKSNLPKALHLISGQPMVVYVLEALSPLKIGEVYVVVGHRAELVKKSINHQKLKFVEQKEQLGTGHALLQTKKYLANKKGDVLVLSGDTPLITPATLRALLETHKESNAAATVLTAVMPDPVGYGRIIRGSKGTIIKIVEEKDASFEEKKIKEVNTGTYCFNITELFDALKALRTDNSQKEYYLTDVIEIMKEKKLPVYACQAPDYQETQGVNTREDLAKVTKIICSRVNQRLMHSGVTLIDPVSIYIDATVEIKPDTLIYPGTIIQGKTTIGSNCRIGPNILIMDSKIEEGVVVKYSEVIRSSVAPKAEIIHSVVVGSKIRKGEKIPPFSNISKSRMT